MNSFSSLDRSKLIESIKNDSFDLIIIGGGVTGGGIALDASSRGLKTLLLEKNDFSSGTSSRSTKLIHGGLRYLKQFEIGLVYEVGRERAILHKLAPHLVRPEKMLLPLIKGGSFGSLITSFGLKLYDFLAGVKGEDRRIILSKRNALKQEPLLNEKTLEGAGYYAEYRTDDARLTLEIIKTANQKYGATCINYLEVVDFDYNGEEVVGVKVKDSLSDVEFSIGSKIVINASGPWVDQLRGKDKSLSGKKLHLTKGVHIVVDYEKLPLNQAVYFDVSDGRMIFAIPRGQSTYIGTTDTNYNGDVNKIPIDLDDVNYLLKGVNSAFPTINLKRDDITSGWAGLRPLIHEEGKLPSELSRKDEIFISKSGLISIAGGKLTGYRKMAKKIVNLAISKIGDKMTLTDLKPCSTHLIPLAGEPFHNMKEVIQYTVEIKRRLVGSNEYVAKYLVSNYGYQTNEIMNSMDASKDQEQALIEAEIQFSIKNEMTVNPCDFFIRRTGRLYFDIRSVINFKKIALDVFATNFSWTKDEKHFHANQLEEAIKLATVYE